MDIGYRTPEILCIPFHVIEYTSCDQNKSQFGQQMNVQSFITRPHRNASVRENERKQNEYIDWCWVWDFIDFTLAVVAENIVKSLSAVKRMYAGDRCAGYEYGYFSLSLPLI